MFWKKKGKGTKSPPAGKKKESSAPAAAKSPPSPAREQLLAQARANAAKARAEIGDETLQKIAAHLQRKEQSAVEQAKAKIRSMDKDRVIDHLKIMIDEE